jgi:uncharacterized protein YyaL (SSP411 family)
MPNRLAAEKSPYLLQHANNPVDWYPWGDEAFIRARLEDKPIFLSIGYATCHWCHVMERESFEQANIAAVLNREYVSIKVDREERPDVDRVYMTFVQATTGAGGWPMSVWLTPDLKPFFGGTYFPPTARWQRPGFIDVLLEIARAWKAERASIDTSAEQMTESLRTLGSGSDALLVPGDDALRRTVAQFGAMYDSRRGGFGDAPKFPRPSELLFLFREYARTGDESARDMALHTLQAMALGGMRDHVGGGFHRYSVDGDWRVPHFEKMLYDQAQLALAYLEAAQITTDPFYGAVAHDTLAYVAREMTDEAGGFFSAEDADSIPVEHIGEPDAHKSEGAFYAWRSSELDALGDDACVVRARFGIEPDGNVPSDPQGEFTGKNLLYTARTIEDVAARCGLDASAVHAALQRSRLRLFEMRLAHPRPLLDDKVLTAWNGLMIAAFARAARVLRSERLGGSAAISAEHLRAATRAAQFLRDRMWNADHQVLYRRYRGGDVAVEGYAEDYAYTIFGALELAQAGGGWEWLAWARTLQARQDALFWDDRHGGWFSTTGADPSVLLRVKDEYDGAEPTASSIGVWNLMTLAHLDEESGFESRITQTFRGSADRLSSQGRVVPMMSAALSGFVAGLGQIVLVGRAAGDPLTARMLDVVAERYLPFTIVVPIFQTEAGDAPGFAASLTAKAETATAYVCRDFTCLEPVTSPDALAAQLDPVPSSRDA